MGHEQLTVSLERQGANRAADVRAVDLVERAVGVEPGDLATGPPVDLGELATDHHLAVGLEGYTADVGVGSGGEGIVTRTVGVEPSHMEVGLSADTGEMPSQQHLAVRLEHQREDPAVGSQPWIKPFVELTVGVQPGNVGTGHATRVLIPATNQDFAVRLHRQREHGAVEAGVEGLVERAIRAQPGQAWTLVAVDLLIAATDQNVSIGQGTIVVTVPSVVG